MGIVEILPFVADEKVTENEPAEINLDAADESSGISMVQRIAEVVPDCGLIGVSRSNDPETIIAAMRAGCGQFVRWPIDQTDLRAAIERRWGRRLDLGGVA